MAKRGNKVTFHGAFSTKTAAVKREREISGAYIEKKGDRYYVISRNPKDIDPHTQQYPKGDPNRYWYDKGFNDALLAIKPRNKKKHYILGYRAGKHYQETREKYGYNPALTPAQIRETQQKRYAKRRKYTGAGQHKTNPPAKLIYGRILEIRAEKTQPHQCDAECTSHGHRYVHTFESRNAKIYGLANGDILISTSRR